MDGQVHGLAHAGFFTGQRHHFERTEGIRGIVPVRLVARTLRGIERLPGQRQAERRGGG
jgi:hypothetical protein